MPRQNRSRHQVWAHAVSGHRPLPWWPVLAGALTISLLLRAMALGRDELWFDEAFAALVAFESPRGIVEELRRDSSPPLYYALLHVWQQAVGADPVQLRAVSVVFGLLAIYLAASLGRTMFDARTGLQTAGLLTLSPLHIYYSREARAYSVLIVFVLWSLINLAKLSQGDRSLTRVALFCLSTVCAAYTHNYGLLLLAVLALWTMRGWVPLGAGIGSAAIILLAYAPWVPGTSSIRWAQERRGGSQASGTRRRPRWRWSRVSPHSALQVQCRTTYCSKARG